VKVGESNAIRGNTACDDSGAADVVSRLKIDIYDELSQPAAAPKSYTGDCEDGSVECVGQVETSAKYL